MIINDSRRGFAKMLGLAGAAGAATLLSKDALAQSSSTPSTAMDIAILNFALNLEYLEAEFYTLGTSGKTIDQMGITISNGSTAGGTTTGGAQVSFFNNSTLYNSLLQIAADERAHVTLLQTAIKGLGGTPIAKPNLNLNALGLGFASQEQFIALARIFEDIGVSAYGGAAPLIYTNAILATAARILAAEAYHASNLRLHSALYQAPGVMLDGADAVPPPTGTQYFPTNANGLTPVRTPGQVLYLAYGNAANATMGGFFPNGVNGTLNTSTTAATSNS
jgi:hypothetical protein